MYIDIKTKIFYIFVFRDDTWYIYLINTVIVYILYKKKQLEREKKTKRIYFTFI